MTFILAQCLRVDFKVLEDSLTLEVTVARFRWEAAKVIISSIALKINEELQVLEGELCIEI